MNTPTKNFIKSPVFLLLMVAVPLPAFSQEAISPETVVTAPANKTDESLVSKRVKSSDTAALLSEVPGVALATGGGVSSLPVVRGLADDRVQVYVDGMCLTSACANHMNPPLSYIAPSTVSSIGVKAGVTPVSYGGDNIGGTILVESDQPVFARPGGELKESGRVSTYYRSVNRSTGASFSGAVAGSNVSFGVTGSIDHANDYKDGHGNTVTSTYYESRNLGATLAVKGDSSLFTLKAGHQLIPEQGFVNQQMDMVENNASFINAAYKKSFEWGKLDAKAYWQNTHHEMNVGRDKLTFPMPMIMPMKTHGRDIGYSLKMEIPFAEKNLLRLGNEFHRFTLDDWWPPVEGTMMAPDTFQSINNGHRDRFSFFTEWESTLSKQVTTVLGVRHEQVRMNTGDVHGYSMMDYGADATAFNDQDHTRNDSNWDITALARFEPSPNGTYEVGYARKTRSPNLYERYAWSTDWMASGMINWFGDGNYYYVRNPYYLRPEVAHTLSISADWHDSSRKSWELNVTPYFTYVNDYIGVNVIEPPHTYGESTFNQLYFVNHDARLYGLDISGKLALWDNSALGSGQLLGSLGYVHGEDLDTGTSLYHMMPLNAHLVLEQRIKGWTNAVELQLVGRKYETDQRRFEPETAAYALVNLRTAYQLKNLRIDLGITNLFDGFYYLPLGGVNFDNYMASNWMGKIGPLAGQGRSFNVGVTQTF